MIERNQRVYVIYRGKVTRGVVCSIMDELVAENTVQPRYVVLPKWDQCVGTMPDYLRLVPKKVYKSKKAASRALFAEKLKNA